MKQKHGFLLTIATSLLLVSNLVGCKGTTHQVKHSVFLENEDNLDFLYNVTYDDYDWQDVTNWMNSENHINPNQGGFGCSSIHCGDFYGRSFDFCYTDMCEFLVRTPKTKDRFATLGISIADCNLNDEKVQKIIDGSGSQRELLNEKLIPFCLVDGINENGVVCNTNVVPAKDLTPHDGEDKYFTHSTNPGKEDLFYQFMPRYILDNAKSAKDAVELLKNRNITAINKKGEQCDYIGISKLGYELHCMIADKDDTFVIELVDDHMNVVRTGANIMTNFYLSNMSRSGAGFERYEILFDAYEEEQINSVDDMKKLIQKVQYSPCYRTSDCVDCPRWPTEFAGVHVIPEVLKVTFYNAEAICKSIWSNIKDKLQAKYDQTQDPYKRESKTGEEVPWISTHAEVYDIANKSLHLITQEKYNNWVEYKL